MMHSEIEKAEMLERYVRNQLAPDERQSFEEHFLGCDECFEKLQTAERFAAGMRDAAERGLLETRLHSRITNSGWLVWAFAATACVALVLAGLAAWAYFGELPRLQSELRQNSARLETERGSESGAEHPVEQAEANVPLVMLQTTRATKGAANVVLKADDKQLVVWIEPGPSRFRDFRLEVFSSGNHVVISVDHLRLSRYGALAASLPTKQLPAGDFRITLTGQDPPPAALAGEYQLKVRRP